MIVGLVFLLALAATTALAEDKTYVWRKLPAMCDNETDVAPTIVNTFQRKFPTYGKAPESGTVEEVWKYYDAESCHPLAPAFHVQVKKNSIVWFLERGGCGRFNKRTMDKRSWCYFTVDGYTVSESAKGWDFKPMEVVTSVV